MSDWRDQPEFDSSVVRTLIDAVGADAFAPMRKQFVTDLKTLGQSCQEALSRGDVEEMKSTAHALKGAAANIGLARLSAVAKHLEKGEVEVGPELVGVLDRSIECLEASF